MTALKDVTQDLSCTGMFDLICSSQLILMEPSNIFTFMGYLSIILKLVVYMIFNDSALTTSKRKQSF